MGDLKRVTVESFGTSVEASALAARLEAEGIDATVEGENYATVDPLVAGGVGAIRVLVPESDLERALAVARERLGRVCPQCGSKNTAVRSLSPLTILISLLLLGIPLLFRTPEIQCQSCRHRWKGK